MPHKDDAQTANSRHTGKFILVRHGESEGNRERRFTISSEVPLTELGRRQAREAATQIARSFKPEVVISSPFARARQTSQIIAAELKLPIEVVRDLHERDLGYLKGHSYDDLREAARTDSSYDPAQGWLWRPRGGESYEDVRRRVVAAIQGLLQRYPTHEVIIVSHGGVMLSLWAHIVGIWQGAHLPPNCGIVLVEHDGQRMSPPQIVLGKESGELG
jgi:broad specificity phosphatase PhoE